MTPNLKEKFYSDFKQLLFGELFLQNNEIFSFNLTGQCNTKILQNITYKIGRPYKNLNS